MASYNAKKMIKSQFIEVYAARMGMTAEQGERAVNTFFAMIYELVAAGDKVKFSGFGTFSYSHRQPRIGVNPRQPGQKITIPELRTPKFVAGEAFKEAVKLR